MILGLVGAVIGCLVLLGAPGNYIRLESEMSYYKELNWTKLDILQSRLDSVFWHFINSSILILSIIYLVLLVTFVKNNTKKGNEKRKIVISSLIFFLTAYSAFIAMLAAPQIPHRSLFFTVSLLVVSIGLLYANISFSRNFFKIVNVFGLAMILAYFSIDYYWKYTTLDYISDIWAKRDLYVEKQKKNGIEDIVFTETYAIHSKYGIFDLRSSPSDWMNVGYANYKGLKSVRLIKEESKDK